MATRMIKILASLVREYIAIDMDSYFRFHRLIEESVTKPHKAL